MLSLKSALTSLANWNKTTEITSRVTWKKSSGSSTVTNFKMWKTGNVITIWIFVQTTASISAGQNIIVGTISSYKPQVDTTSASYVSSHIVAGSLTAGGTLIIRNGSGTIASGNGIGINFMYISPD